ELRAGVHPGDSERDGDHLLDHRRRRGPRPPDHQRSVRTPGMHRVTGTAGRLRESAKMTLRSGLHRRNLDLVRNPFPVRVATALRWLGIDTVLDVGANVGQYGSALRSSGFDGRIVSCEPLPDAHAALSRRCASDPMWTALPTAVGAEPGTVSINVSANSYSSSVLPMLAAHLDAAP